MLPPFRPTACLLLAGLLLAAPLAAADDPLVGASASAAGRDLAADAGRHHEVVVDGAARGTALAAALASPAGRAVLASLPGTLALRGALVQPVLADGTTIASALPYDVTVRLDPDGRDAIVLDPASALASGEDAAATRAAAGADRWRAPDVGADAPAGAWPASAFAGRIDAAAPANEPVELGARDASETRSSYRPAAVALQEAPSSGAAVAVAGAALLVVGALTLWPLYHRLNGARTLESGTRRRIFDAVCARPGAGVPEVAAKAGVSYSTATYHLERLVKEGMLVTGGEGGRLRYFKNGGFNEDDRRLLCVAENPEAMRLLGLIRANPGTYRAALADALGVTTTTVNWHLKRLAAVGLVREVRAGRSAHLYPVEERVAAATPLVAKAQPAPGDAARA